MRWVLLLLAASVAGESSAFARQATCIIPHPGDRSRKLVSFDVDERQFPYITNVNGIDGGASDEQIVDIALFNPTTAEYAKWYYSDVEIKSDETRSRIQVSFGGSPFRSGKFAPHNRYTLYIDWKYGTAGWLDENMMYNLMGILDKLPTQAAYPAECHRRD